MGRLRGLGCALLATTALALAGAAPVTAGGASYTQMAPLGGLAMPGSPFRFQTITVGARHRLTIVAQVRRHGGLIGRRWILPGAWHLNAPAYDREGTGLAAHGSVLVVSRYGAPRHSGLRKHTELAFLYTGPYRPHGPRPIRRVTLPGDYTVQGVSPDGQFVYLARNLNLSARNGPRFTLVPYSIRAHLLLPANDIRANGEILSGSALARAADASERHIYTLYMDPLGPHGRVYLLALDTGDASLAKLDLPCLRGTKNPLLLDLHLSPSGHVLTIRKRSSREWVDHERVLARIDLRKFQSRPAHRATASTASAATASRVGAVGSLSPLRRPRRARLPAAPARAEPPLPRHLVVRRRAAPWEAAAAATDPARRSARAVRRGGGGRFASGTERVRLAHRGDRGREEHLPSAFRAA